MPKGNRAIVKAANKHSIFIDSSAWIALFSRRDQHHEDADRRFRAIISAKQPMVTSNLVLAEIHRLFLHRAGIKAAAASLEKIDASSLVEIVFADITHHRSAIAWISKLREHSISYADAVSFSIMQEEECGAVLSYDHHFQIAGFKILSR